MSKDLLAEATHALRETEPASEFEARATRTRIMSGLHQRRIRRRTRLAFVLPIAASFVAVSARGAVSGHASRALDRLERFVGISGSAPSSAKPPPRRIAAPRPSSSETTATEQAQPGPSHSVDPKASLPIAAGAAGPARVTASVGSAGRAPQADPALALYRTAHAAHFVDRDPARALAAWDAYLSAAPSGAFVPEARYNRALSLVRLGRSQEARSALEPFAKGAYGSYRQVEASALLERLAP